METQDIIKLKKGKQTLKADNKKRFTWDSARQVATSAIAHIRNNRGNLHFESIDDPEWLEAFSYIEVRLYLTFLNGWATKDFTNDVSRNVFITLCDFDNPPAELVDTIWNDSKKLYGRSRNSN